MPRILVVDDEATLVATLRFNLEKEAYTVLSASDGEQAVALARESDPDLVILDLMLPRMSGLEVCRILRAESNIPIIILSARDDETDRVVGLELGADDYITKPFSMKELIARVRTRLRRKEAPAAVPETLVARSLTVDLPRRIVTRNGAAVDLKPKEFDLLVYFLQNRGRVLTRAQILQAVWHYDGFDTTRTIDVHVGRLRNRIEESPEDPKLILTVRGVGYRFSG